MFSNLVMTREFPESSGKLLPGNCQNLNSKWMLNYHESSKHLSINYVFSGTWLMLLLPVWGSAQKKLRMPFNH